MRLPLILLAGLMACSIAACDSIPPKDEHEYPDKGSPAFEVYARNCSECHAPPLPSAHPANQWPGVIARMQQHLVQRSMAPISTQDLLVLRDYLVAHAPEE